MSRLVYTGGIMVDIVLGVPRLPETGGDAYASYHQTSVGGGFNVLAAARRDGLAGVFAGRTGVGPLADLVQRALGDEGLASCHPPVADLDNGFCVVLVDETTERTFITSPGAEEHVSAEALRSLDVGDDDFVHVSGYALASPTRSGPLSAWVSQLPAGPRLVVDASPLIDRVDPRILTTVLARTDVFTCNAREAGIICGGSSGPAAAAMSIRRRLPAGAAVVVRDGSRGTWGGDEDTVEAWHVPAYRVAAVDSNGAGDAHAGVLIAALSTRSTLREAVVRANVAAALAVTRHGPATAPTSAEIDEALQLYARDLIR